MLTLLWTQLWPQFSKPKSRSGWTCLTLATACVLITMTSPSQAQTPALTPQIKARSRLQAHRQLAQGKKYLRLKNPKEAHAYFTIALDSAQQEHVTPELLAECARSLADTDMILSRNDEALEHYEMARHNLELVYGPRHQALDPVLFRLTRLYRSRGQYKQALACAQQVLSMRRALLSPSDPDMMKAEVELYMCLLCAGEDLHTAEGRLLSIASHWSPLEKVGLMSELANLRSSIQELTASGKTKPAIACLRSIINCYEKLGRPKGINIFVFRYDLCSAIYATGNYAAAEAEILHTLKEAPTHLTKNDSVMVGSVWYSLSLTRLCQHRPAAALEPALKAVQFMEVMGKDFMGMTSSLLCAAQAYTLTNDPRAEKYWLRALALNRGKGPDSGLNTCLHDLEVYYRNHGRFNEARQCVESSLKVEQAQAGFTANRHALHLLLLADLDSSTKAPGKSDALVRQAVALINGPNYKNTYDLMTLLTNVTLSTIQLYLPAKATSEARSLEQLVEECLRTHKANGTLIDALKNAKDTIRTYESHPSTVGSQ